ncbi:MAG: Fic family protein [Candidatus Adiutrix sp.]
MPYIHELSGWPNFKWDMDKLSNLLASIRHKQGLLLGRMDALGFSARAEAGLETLTLDVVKSSAIEGEVLNVPEVRSSLARRLGIDIGGLAPANSHVDGMVEMMLNATQSYNKPLTAERLFCWHLALFPVAYSNFRKITVGAFRILEAGPMQVVSGPMGHERVHFEAPSAYRLEKEMAAFLDWFNTSLDFDPVLKAGIAHFWFVTIHPFEDGNGRIARAIADCALARADNTSVRFYSMSSRIEQERSVYYNILEQSQRGGLDITCWLDWFLSCLGRAIDGADKTLTAVFRKTQVWQIANQHQLNERQRMVINQLLGDFVGKLTSSKYAKLAKCSQDTAMRDIKELIDCGLIKLGDAGGRSTHYKLCQ